MDEFPTVSESIIRYIKSQNLFEFEPKPHHYIVDDLNFDSLDITELAIYLEEIYDITIDDGYLFKHVETLGELTEMIKLKFSLL